MQISGKELYRSTDNRVIAGVCGGIAEVFQTDPVLVRIIFLFLTLIGAGGIFLYLVLWAMLPEKNTSDHDHNHEHNHQDHRGHPHEFAHEVKSHMDRSHSAAHGLLGLFIILIGFLLLADQLFPNYGVQKFWPLFVIAFGALIMFRRQR